MNKFFSITVFFLLLSAVCWAGGKKDKGTQTTPQTQQQTAPQPAQPQTTPASVTPASPYFTGDGGKGMSIAILTPQANGLDENQGYLPALVQGEFVSNFSGFSAISVLDRQRLDEQYSELFSGYYDDNTGTDFGHLTPTTHIMGGTITRTTTGYTLQIQITKNADKMTAASHSGTITFAELDNLTGIRRASLELLEKIGVTPTERTRTELAGAATANQVNAQTALARGITAQRQGTEVAALSYYFQAAAFDPFLLEAANRSSILNANIASGNIGDNVRNDIQWRRDWVARLTETEQYFDNFNRTESMPYTLFYADEIKQGTINYQNETVTLSIETNLRGSHLWALAVERALQSVYDGLDATKRKGDWGLANWPRQGVTNLNPFTKRSKDFSVVAELMNNRNEVIGRQTLPAGGSWEFDLRSHPGVTVSEDNKKTMSFPNVDAGKITDNLTIRFASVNGTEAETAARNGVLQIRAIPKDEFDLNSKLKIVKGEVQGFAEEVTDKRSDVIINSTAWGEPITSIRRYAFSGQTSITIPDNVSLGDRAFDGIYLKRITIGANVNLSSTSISEFSTRTYDDNGKKAGTYTRATGYSKWTFTPR